MSEIIDFKKLNMPLVYQLDSTTMNVIYVPTGQMPQSKSKELLKDYTAFLKSHQSS